MFPWISHGSCKPESKLQHLANYNQKTVPIGIRRKKFALSAGDLNARKVNTARQDTIGQDWFSLATQSES